MREAENVSTKVTPIVRIRNLGDNGVDYEVKYWLVDYAKYNDTDALYDSESGTPFAAPV